MFRQFRRHVAKLAAVNEECKRITAGPHDSLQGAVGQHAGLCADQQHRRHHVARGARGRAAESGAGFDPDGGPLVGSLGHGLVGMRRRAELIGADLSIDGTGPGTQGKVGLDKGRGPLRLCAPAVSKLRASCAGSLDFQRIARGLLERTRAALLPATNEVAR